jgi:hypothetical protein
LCWIDQHEGVGVWAGAVATLLAVCVALVLPFLMRASDHADARRRIASNSVLAIHHATGILHLIMELQTELCAIGQTPLNRTNRQWAFDLVVMDGALKLAMDAELRDPMLLRLLVACREWAQMALSVLSLDPDKGLFELQFSTATREATTAELLRLRKQFLALAPDSGPGRDGKSESG